LQAEEMNKKALFTGTFDPFTTGHYALVQRAFAFADEIVIAIGVNMEKKTFFSLEERINNLKKIYAGEDRVFVTSYDCLTADYAAKIGADYILRGIRNISDFEYEKNMAYINKKLSGVETLILFSDPEFEHVSSNIVREFIKYNKDITNLIPIIK
jgi:pantetheine-phosphate adenylyltransferase